MAGLKEHLETDEISVVSYADDTYVLVVPRDVNKTLELTTITLIKHVDYLRSLGMVVNEEKTEIMWIGAKKAITHKLDSLTVNNKGIHLTHKMKALGIYFQGDLSWDAQAEHTLLKSKKLLSAFRFLRKYLTEEQFLKAASANYYGSVFYSSIVWYQNLKQTHKNKLNSIHFRMLRTAKKDYKMKLKRDELTNTCKRATPDQWNKFITSSKVIKIIREQAPVELATKLQSTYFEEKKATRCRLLL